VTLGTVAAKKKAGEIALSGPNSRR